MGVKGLPQSGTGQTALFTGYNGAQIMGRHVAGFPPYSLRPYLKKHSILHKFMESGYKASLINAYTETYLKRLEGPRSERLMSASTLMQRGTGNSFLNETDLREDRSIFMDITHWVLRRFIEDIPLKDPKERGRTLVKIAKNYDLSVFEYFLADRIGHEGIWDEGKKILYHLDEFLSGVWEDLDPENQCVVICSDHGNFEDLSNGLHTDNMTPLYVYGKNEAMFDESIKSLYDIPRRMYQWKNIDFSEEVPEVELG
ncbi:MAG: hypothetical protein ABUK01_02150 [Leptospirales bacterium]